MSQDLLDEALNNISSHSSVCFVGAGFSGTGKDSNNNCILSTEELAKEICKTLGVEYDNSSSLTDLADYCQNEGHNTKLNQLLIESFTLCKPSPSQSKILRAPWRSIFTTNFDDIIERTLDNSKLQVVSPSAANNILSSDKCPVIYLHGRALDLMEKNANPNLVISETNYLNLKQSNANLYAALRNEIHCAKWIFFIGYSLRDLGIAEQLLSLGNTLKSKSIVICSQTDSDIAKSRLKKFGSVYSIGVDGFANKLPENFAPIQRNNVLANLAYVKQTPDPALSSEVTSNDVERLVLSGEFNSPSFAAQNLSEDEQALYCVQRSKNIEKVFDGIDNGMNRFLVSSEIGNGKTIFLKQLEYKAKAENYDVFCVDTNVNEIYSELELLLARPNRQMFIVDDLIRGRQIVNFIGSRLNRLSVLVSSTRAVTTDFFGEASQTFGGSLKEIDLDRLNSSEILEWNKLLERWGLWGDRIRDTQSQRVHFLSHQCSAENRSIVISIFKMSALADKIKNIVSYFLTTNPKHSRAFVAILIGSLCQKHVRWEQLVDWLHIDEDTLQNDLKKSALFSFMSGQREWYRLSSSQLADYVFKNYSFDNEIIVSTYTEIVKQTAYSANDPRSGADSRENLKELLRFRFLTHLFGEDSVAYRFIETVYRRLSSVQRIRDNDQFWLQYAMAKMEVGDLNPAEKYLETALGIASKKGMDYSPHQILDQRIRLYFRKNTQKSININFDEIDKAIEDLSNSLEKQSTVKIHPIRSVIFILDFLEEKIDLLEPTLRTKLMEIIEKMQNIVENGSISQMQKGELRVLKQATTKSLLILKNA